MFPNLITNDYKLHAVVNGLVTFWLISTSVCCFALMLRFFSKIVWIIKTHLKSLSSWSPPLFILRKNISYMEREGDHWSVGQF